jgi:hypothetical protein
MLSVHVENIGEIAVIECEGRIVRSDAAFRSALVVAPSSFSRPCGQEVKKRIPPEVSLDRVRPAARFGAWFSLLPQNGKDEFRSLPERARGK